MTKEDLIERLKDFTYWYHKIELAPGVITPGFDLDDLWANLRKVEINGDVTTFEYGIFCSLWLILLS